MKECETFVTANGVVLNVSRTDKNALAEASGTAFRLCHRAEAATYAVRCTCVCRSVYVRMSFGVRAYVVRRTCVQRSAYVIVRVESDDETGVKGVAGRCSPTEKTQEHPDEWLENGQDRQQLHGAWRKCTENIEDNVG